MMDFMLFAAIACRAVDDAAAMPLRAAATLMLDMLLDSALLRALRLFYAERHLPLFHDFHYAMIFA